MSELLEGPEAPGGLRITRTQKDLLAGTVGGIGKSFSVFFFLNSGT